MQARDVYELRRESSSGGGRWWRRLGQLVILIVLQGELMTGGGSKTFVVETATGRVFGVLEQDFGEDYFDYQLEEDLLSLSVEDFRTKWEWLYDAG